MDLKMQHNHRVSSQVCVNVMGVCHLGVVGWEAQGGAYII